MFEMSRTAYPATRGHSSEQNPQSHHYDISTPFLFASRVPICQKFKHIIKDTFRKEEEKHEVLKYTQKNLCKQKKIQTLTLILL